MKNGNQKKLPGMIKYITVIVAAYIIQSLSSYWTSGPLKEFFSYSFIPIVILLLFPMGFKEFLPWAKSVLVQGRSDPPYNSKIEDVQTALDIMKINLNEITDYYAISKNQAKIAFCAALFTAAIGFMLICFCVALIITQNTDAVYTVLTGVSGIISEFLASTFLLIYNKSIKQINFFYESLNKKEMYLTSIELIKSLGDNKDEMIARIIDRSLTYDVSK